MAVNCEHDNEILLSIQGAEFVTIFFGWSWRRDTNLRNVGNHLLNEQGGRTENSATLLCDIQISPSLA